MSVPDPSAYRPPPEVWERNKLGIDLRQKYELYLVSLIFTIAALSVQSAPHHVSRCQTLVEILGWTLLLIAGTLGLWRISNLWLREVGVAEYQLNSANYSGEFPRSLEKVERWIRISGYAQFWLFVAGFLCVAAARASGLLLE